MIGRWEGLTGRSDTDRKGHMGREEEEEEGSEKNDRHS
jgi:hypothetical protein